MSGACMDMKTELERVKRERDSLKQQLAEANAACAAIREALEAVQDSPVITGKDTKAVWLQVSSATRKSISKALSLDAGKDLLERLEKAESIIKRTAQDRHRLIRNAACKQCKEFPCEGDDRVLCIHKNLMTDIDAFLKDTPAPFTGVEPFEATVSPLNCDGYKKGGGEDA